MKAIMTILICLLLAGNGYSQALKKYPIGNSGCSAYFYCNPGNFEMSKTPDSSDVYTAQCAEGEMTYGLICVKMKGRVTDLEKSESVLIAYLDYIKLSLNITKAAGYGKGHRLRNNDHTRGILDYWQDKDNNNWKIKGWTDGKYIACMYVYTAKLLNENKGDIFLNGLDLPAL